MAASLESNPESTPRALSILESLRFDIVGWNERDPEKLAVPRAGRILRTARRAPARAGRGGPCRGLGRNGRWEECASGPPAAGGAGPRSRSQLVCTPSNWHRQD